VHDEKKVRSLPDKDCPHIFLFRPVKDFSSGILDHRLKSGPVIHFRSSCQHYSHPLDIVLFAFLPDLMIGLLSKEELRIMGLFSPWVAV